MLAGSSKRVALNPSEHVPLKRQRRNVSPRSFWNTGRAGSPGLPAGLSTPRVCVLNPVQTFLSWKWVLPYFVRLGEQIDDLFLRYSQVAGPATAALVLPVLPLRKPPLSPVIRCFLP